MSKFIPFGLLLGLAISCATVSTTESGVAADTVRILSFRAFESEPGQNELMFQELEESLMGITFLSGIVSSYSKDSVRMDLSFASSEALHNSTNFVDALVAEYCAAHPEFQLDLESVALTPSE